MKPTTTPNALANGADVHCDVVEIADSRQPVRRGARCFGNLQRQHRGLSDELADHTAWRQKVLYSRSSMRWFTRVAAMKRAAPVARTKPKPYQASFCLRVR